MTAQPTPPFDRTRPLSHEETVHALAALGHDKRLRLFRLLVQAGPSGLNVGDLGAHLGAPASTVAHHLSGLVAAGLVDQERRGREIVNRARFDTMEGAVAFLTAQCCSGLTLTRNAAA